AEAHGRRPGDPVGPRAPRHREPGEGTGPGTRGRDDVSREELEGLPRFRTQPLPAPDGEGSGGDDLLRPGGRLGPDPGGVHGRNVRRRPGRSRPRGPPPHVRGGVPSGVPAEGWRSPRVASCPDPEESRTRIRPRCRERLPPPSFQPTSPTSPTR